MSKVIDIINRLKEDGTFEDQLTRVDAQFGQAPNPFLGARYLPEQTKTANSYTETDVRFQGAPPALDNARYSPPQMQDSGAITASVAVSFGATDNAGQMKPDMVDEMNMILESSADSEGIQRITDWFNKTLVWPHLVKNEIQRWQALVKYRVPRRGNQGYLEDVTYWRPTTHTLTIAGGTQAAPAGWHDFDNYDPIEDILAGEEILTERGYAVTSIVCTRTLQRILARSKAIIRRSIGTALAVSAGGVLSTETYPSSVNTSLVNSVLAGEDLPPITRYNAAHPYTDMAATPRRIRSRRFLEFDDGFDYFIMFGSTNREVDLILPEDEKITLNNVLGYYGVGSVATYSQPGRRTNIQIEQKHPRVPYGESMQFGFPVITNPDSYVLIRVAKPT